MLKDKFFSMLGFVFDAIKVVAAVLMIFIVVVLGFSFYRTVSVLSGS